MKLETILKPIKYLDEDILLRQYTKLGQRIDIDKGIKKYVIGEILWEIYLFTSVIGLETNIKLLGKSFNLNSYLILGINDKLYNLDGILGRFKEINNSSDSFALDKEKENYKKYNSIVRLPTFLFGVGLLGKFGIDVINSIKNRTPLESTSYYCLFDGIGHLSLASSMYLKETDPKLLDKVPLWKQALEYIQEKVSLIGQQPIPVPTMNYEISKNK